MTRNAKLYILTDIDWKPLAEIIHNHEDRNIKNDITIFQLPRQESKENYYAILSLSSNADLILEKYGAYHSPRNTLTAILHDYRGEPLFGHKSNTDLLRKK
ncbi:MAG: hypothetical protein ABI185_00350 [Ginsengibacter sp.]